MSGGEQQETGEQNYVANSSRNEGVKMFFFGLADGSALVLKGQYELVRQDESSRRAAKERQDERNRITRETDAKRKALKSAAEKGEALKLFLEDKKKAAELVRVLLLILLHSLSFA